MKITLKDGSVKEYEAGTSVMEIAKDISGGLARAACAGEVNGRVVDLRTEVSEDCELNILTANDKEGLQTVRHTASHVPYRCSAHNPHPALSANPPLFRPPCRSRQPLQAPR